MKVLKLVSLGLVVSIFVAAQVGCAGDTGGDESDQGSEALSNNGPSTGSSGHTIMKVDPPPQASTGGDKPSVSSAAPANTIMKQDPPAPTPSSSGAPGSGPTTSPKLHCTSASTSGVPSGRPIGPDGCIVGEICCASPVYGHAPICIAGNVCPLLP